MSDFSVSGIAFTITSGIANSSRVASALSQLTNIKLSPGYRDSTQADPSSVNISPNTNGFLLLALMMSQDYDPVSYLLDNLWGAMVTNDEFSSGASWEYVAQDLSPGLGLFTSLSHPWGGAPTYILPQWVTGVRAIMPGYKTWLVEPAYNGFNLSWAAAKVNTLFGNLSAKWILNGTVLTVNIDAPQNTRGSFALPGRGSMESYVINGRKLETTAEFISLIPGRSVIIISVK